MNHSQKYCRTLHAPISLGTTSDDRFVPAGYLEAFSRMDKVVLTEKLDGQNNCFTRHGVYARSHTAPTAHPWDKPMRERWELIRNDLGDLEIFGENMYGIHSIAYRNLESYYYVFGIREKGRWLSWEEVCFYASMLDFPVVPEIPVRLPLKELFDAGKGETQILEEWLTANLGMPWLEAVETGGTLEGYDPETGNSCCEGFVVRDAGSYATNAGNFAVAPNEFDSLFKLVRKAHVKTDVHWTKSWKTASLVDCRMYKWFGYEYLKD